jgi:hypothetical protein
MNETERINQILALTKDLLSGVGLLEARVAALEKRWKAMGEILQKVVADVKPNP